MRILVILHVKYGWHKISLLTWEARICQLFLLQEEADLHVILLVKLNRIVHKPYITEDVEHVLIILVKLQPGWSQ